MPIRALTPLFLVTVLAAAPVYGQSETPPELEAVPEPPPLPAQVRSGETLEPDVRIIQREDKVITEYVVNGRVRAVKVEHKDTDIAPYYLIDTDGDGRLDRRVGEFDDRDLAIPHWVLFSW